MRAENDDQSSTVHLVQVINEPKKPKISYTRETLLSLSELDICKKLPKGFDATNLSEFEEASNSIPERPRVPGSLSSQHFRRGDYGSSPPTGGDSGNYTRGVHGRWDSRSSGSNYRDGDSQSDWDSDFGKRYGNQAWRSWQNSEHDGLLGSGAFPRPSEYTPGASASKGQGNNHYQLNKSNEPYHPPRPYKAVPHSRRDTDMYNNETFGSSECSSDDRSEEERRRRASFELFRKEQQKGYPLKQKGNVKTDIFASLVDSEDNKKHRDKNNELEVRPTIPQTDSAKCALPAQTPASRPLVPPGFTGTTLEKSLGTKSCTLEPAVEQVGSIGRENVSHGEGNLVTNDFSGNNMEKKPALFVDSNEQQCEIRTVRIPATDASEKLTIQPLDEKDSGVSTGDANPSYKISNLPEAYEGPRDGVDMSFDAEKILGNGNTNITCQDHATSILEKLFGVAAPVTSCSSDFIECGDVKADDVGGSIPFRSSKFTPWFIEEENKQEDETSLDQPNDLLSLIVGGEKSGLQASGVTDKEPLIFPFRSNEPMHNFKSTAMSATVETSEPFYQYENPNATPGVLTCEDLEQSILSGINENRAALQDSIKDGAVSDAKAGDSIAEVDSRASHHLLSLLQKGTMEGPASNLEASSGNLSVNDGGIITCAFNNSSGENTSRTNSDMSLTLETLFGSAFMHELQSVEAPVSVHRATISGPTRTDVSKSQGFTFPAANDGIFPLGNDTRDSSGTQRAKSNKLERQWLRLNASHSGGGGLDLKSVDGIEDKADGAPEILVPEEEILISVADTVVPRHSIAMPAENVINADLLSSSGMPIDIADKLAALNSVLKNERSIEGPPFLSGPHHVEPNVQGWQSSPQLAHLQMNQWRPPFQPLEPHCTHMNSHIKFMGPENIFQPEAHHQHHFPANITLSQSFQNASVGSARFDPPGHHPMLQQMHMPLGNLLPPQLLQGVPRGAPLQAQSINHIGGYPPELSPMHGFPLGQRQRSFGGHEMPIPGIGVGGGGDNHPEALEKLIEMQLGANMKVVGRAYNQQQPQQGATHGHGIDLGFR